MFNDFCYLLNRIKLSYVAAFIRWVLYKTAGNAYLDLYDTPVAGYKAYITRPGFGVIVFIDTADRLHYRW